MDLHRGNERCDAKRSALLATLHLHHRFHEMHRVQVDDFLEDGIRLARGMSSTIESLRRDIGAYFCPYNWIEDIRPIKDSHNGSEL